MQPGPYREAIEKQQFALSTVSIEASTQPSSSIAAASSSNPPVPPLPTEDAPPSYEDSTKVNNPGLPVPDRVPELPERAYQTTAHQTAIEIPNILAAAQPAYEEIIGDLVRVPSGLTMIRPEDKSEVYKNPSVWLGIICVVRAFYHRTCPLIFLRISWLGLWSGLGLGHNHIRIRSGDFHRVPCADDRSTCGNSDQLRLCNHMESDCKRRNYLHNVSALALLFSDDILMKLLFAVQCSPPKMSCDPTFPLLSFTPLASGTTSTSSDLTARA
ncbi:hypothetical protein BJ742DRAFT_500993 [Cladochytrium replicatum]|nr:hypothetical protein BJ742DRAFT_500993 [Cladochytrium replicatum]